MHKITYRNEKLSASAMARKYNQIPATVLWRLRNGYSVEQALNGKRQNDARITVNGVTKTVRGWCRHIGIKREAFYARRKAYPNNPEKWTRKRIVRRGPITAWGRTQMPLAWSRERNINKHTFLSRLDAGMSPELALTLAVAKRPPILARGQL